MKVKITVWSLVVIIVLIFVIGNAEPMELMFIKKFHVSKIIVILSSLAVGFIAGLLVEGRKNKSAKKPKSGKNRK